MTLESGLLSFDVRVQGSFSKPSIYVDDRSSRLIAGDGLVPFVGELWSDGMFNSDTSHRVSTENYSQSPRTE